MLFDGTLGESLSLLNIAIIIGFTIIIGLIIGFTYFLLLRRKGYSLSMFMTLIILPTVIAMIILLIGNNVARAFSLAGAFAIIRFRSAPGSAKDITYIFITLAAGLACGLGYVMYALLLTLVILFVIVIISYIVDKNKAFSNYQLRLVIPEDIDYVGLFDKTLKENTKYYNLAKVRTSDFGTTFQLTYNIQVRNDFDQKKFIDELRVLNGNLNITLILSGEDNAL